ncbi:MAG: hypothetical protein WKG07_15035, partial [Hymenobacter sp.]
MADPSADDFRHHLDRQLYDRPTSKSWAATRTTTATRATRPKATRPRSTAYPDKEDLNRDNVIQDVEQYHEYVHSAGAQRCPPPRTVGQNYIADKATRRPLQQRRRSGDVVPV